MVPSIPIWAHQETQQVPTEEVSLEVLLSNGQKVLVNVLTSDQTEDVLEVRHWFCTCPCTLGSRLGGGVNEPTSVMSWTSFPTLRLWLQSWIFQMT